MITELAQPLKLDFEPLAWPHKVYDYRRVRHTMIPTEHLSSELTAWLASLDLCVEWAELFYTQPGQITQIHTDGRGGDYTKLNWQYGGQSSRMRWYRPIKAEGKKTVLTPISSDYIFYSAMEVEPLGEAQVGYPSLVQVGQPHNIVNLLAHRWVLSVIFNDRTQGGRLTWAQAQERFSQQLV